MGDANYRFDYDSQVIKNPAIVSQENYASVAPASDTRYNPQTLNGSTAGPTLGTVSLNTTYGGSGTGAKLVPTTWTTVSCIQFDIVNTTLVTSNCFGLRWHTDTTFPVTGLSEVILKANNDQVNSLVAKASGVFQNLYVKPLAEVCGSLSSPETGEFMIPEGFSPDGDGINDRFVLYNLGSLKASLTVYNLSGAIIYSQDNYQNDWDGKTDRGVAPAGTYFYSIRLSDGRSFERSMTISH
ncbi:hypothetical protein GCM10028818_23010 [Spirosoma horti]